MKTETTRETAEKIAAEHIGSASYYAEQRRFCADAIESALDAERERAVKIAEAAEAKWLADARNIARADDLVGGLAQSTYTMYAEIAGGIAKTIRGSKE